MKLYRKRGCVEKYTVALTTYIPINYIVDEMWPVTDPVKQSFEAGFKRCEAPQAHRTDPVKNVKSNEILR